MSDTLSNKQMDAAVEAAEADTQRVLDEQLRQSNRINQHNIDRLWQLQEASAKNVQAIADQMAAIPRNGLYVTQDRWDQLIRAWEQANQRLQEIGDALMKAHGL